MHRIARSAAGIVAAATLAWTGPAAADGYRGVPFSAEAWFGTPDALKLRYRLYVGAGGYRLESVRPADGPDIIIAQFNIPQFIYIDLDTGSVNFLPMGEDDWGRFHGIACADFEYRKKLGDSEAAGRATEVWQSIGSTRYMQDTEIHWDPALRYQVRSDEQGYITQLRNIKPGEPDTALFDAQAARN